MIATFSYVHAPAEVAVERSLGRAKDLGRYVTAEHAAKTVADTAPAIERAKKRFGDQLKVSIIDNSRKGEPATEVPIENIQSLRYAGTKDELLTEQQAELDRLHAAGEIPKEVHQRSHAEFAANLTKQALHGLSKEAEKSRKQTRVPSSADVLTK